MRVHSTLRFGVALTLGALVLAATPVAASAKGTPRLFLAPSGALKAGQLIKVRGVGFTPKDTVYLTECLATAKGQSGCNIQGIPPSVTISAKGTFAWTSFKVVSGKIGTGTCGTKTSNLRSCAISAGNAAGKDTASVRFTFLAPKK